MSFSYRDAVMFACTRLLERTEIADNLDLPYALPYMNYVLSWPDNLPIKLIIIGQNPYNKDIYPYMGAALSYDPAVLSAPPKSVLSLAEDLYESNSIPMHQTIHGIFCLTEH
jgi:uracil DNA glycosylase